MTAESAPQRPAAPYPLKTHPKRPMNTQQTPETIDLVSHLADTLRRRAADSEQSLTAQQVTATRNIVAASAVAAAKQRVAEEQTRAAREEPDDVVIARTLAENPSRILGLLGIDCAMLAQTLRAEARLRKGV